jgi:putative cell wall-binding protein
VFIATGANYPDALAGGAAAGRLGGTLLLTTKDQLPAETVEAFDWLDPSRIVLLGGASAISESVRGQIQAVLPGVPVDRAAGSDRFATAAATSALTFPGTAAKVYLATGAGFPDALAAAPVAGPDGAPLLLTTHQCVPEPTLAEIRRLNPSSVVVLGGENAVSTTAANLGACSG